MQGVYTLRFRPVSTFLIEQGKAAGFEIPNDAETLVEITGVRRYLFSVRGPQ